jgi:hypothetical protein
MALEVASKNSGRTRHARVYQPRAQRIAILKPRSIFSIWVNTHFIVCRRFQLGTALR